MSLTLHQTTVPVLVHGLRQLSHVLDKGLAHATAQGLDPATLVNARLAADMLPLSGQVQRASDTAKASVQRLSQVAAPKLEDNEQTFEQLQARIAATIDYLLAVPAEAFEGERDIVLKFGPLQTRFDGPGYLTEFALPNFFFHVTTAYGILRNQGVAIGKLDYLGRIGQADPA
ncbi:MAG TPA: DUF1993 domain-containing protein [Stenotrophomonas sp.]|nr:DUF1993 domain-containing protein [Stenotrophomonas sp.]